MSNRFGLDVTSDQMRWSAADGVSKDVIAAVLLLHERSVDEIVPELSRAELEQVIELVGRSPLNLKFGSNPRYQAPSPKKRTSRLL
jgi:hypothetical protein